MNFLKTIIASIMITLIILLSITPYSVEGIEDKPCIIQDRQKIYDIIEKTNSLDFSIVI